MAGSSNQMTYSLGATLLSVATGSTATAVTVPAGCNGLVFGYQSGGTLAVVNQLGATTGNGFVLTTTERISVDGPSSFFLAAAGTTAIAGIVFKYSAGQSLRP